MDLNLSRNIHSSVNNCKHNRKMFCKQKCSQIRKHMNQIHETQLKTHFNYRNRNKCPKSPPRGMGVITAICVNNTKLSKHFKFYSTITMLIKCIFEKIQLGKIGFDWKSNKSNRFGQLTARVPHFWSSFNDRCEWSFVFNKIGFAICTKKPITIAGYVRACARARHSHHWQFYWNDRAI